MIGIQFPRRPPIKGKRLIARAAEIRIDSKQNKIIKLYDRITEEVNTWRSLIIVTAIAKLPKYRNLFKLTF